MEKLTEIDNYISWDCKLRAVKFKDYTYSHLNKESKRNGDKGKKRRAEDSEKQQNEASRTEMVE